MMHRAGIPLVTIARIFGHSDTRTTERYLGLDFDDMSGAMSLYAAYQGAVDSQTPEGALLPQTVKNELSQLNGGGTGI
jgi:hypothetical protein